jgi:hypothetical protein
MADAWSAGLEASGSAWGIPNDKITEFKGRLAAARALLSDVSSNLRTAVNTERCREAFHELWLSMRFLKSNYFNSPPRTGEELIALGLAVHDGVPTPIHTAEVVPGVSLHNTDGHGILVKLFTDAQPQDPRGADHFFCKWGLKPQGRWAAPEEAAADSRLLTREPSRADDLPMHFSTSRRRHDLAFSLADIGLEIFLSACWQTPRNQEGPYCAITSRIIA